MESTWLQAVLDWVELHPHATGWMIFLVAFGESLLLVGILLPGAALLVGLGTLIGLGVVDFKLAWIAASLGAFVGDGLSFWIGHYYKKGLLKMWPIYKFPKLVDSGQTFFTKWGALSVFIGRFVGLVRPIIPAIAGMMAMPVRKYIIISAVAAVLWAPFYLLPGMLFGNAMGAMSKVAGKLTLLLVVFVIAVALIYWLINLIYGFLLPRTHRILAKVLVWSQKHPRFGRLTSGLVDPRKPEKGSLALMAVFIVALTMTSLFFIAYSESVNQWSLQVSRFMLAFKTDWTEPVMLFIMALTHDLTILVSSAMVFLWLLKRKRRVAAFHWIFIVLTGYILALLINYFSTEGDKNWFGYQHLTWFVTVIAYWAALVSGALPHKMRSWPYALSTLLVAMVSFTQLFFNQMSLGVVLISIFSAILWASVVAIAYRMRNRQQFLAWPVSAIFFSFQGLMIIVVLVFFTSHLQQQINIELKQVSKKQWLAETVQERKNWLNVPKQTFQVRYHGSINVISDHLQLEGWSELKPQAWKDVWRALSADEKDESVPFIPTTNNGKIETVIFTKKVDNNLFALHLWKQPIKISSSDFNVYAGYVTQNRIDKNWGLTFWKNQNDPEAIMTLINSLDTSQQLNYSLINKQYFIQIKDQ
ncbi:MAG: DedA family protein [Marinicellaceae bacterium]